jgi:uncharacterized C2H2 Zn-finger protein
MLEEHMTDTELLEYRQWRDEQQIKLNSHRTMNSIMTRRGKSAAARLQVDVEDASAILLQVQLKAEQIRNNRNNNTISMEESKENSGTMAQVQIDGEESVKVMDGAEGESDKNELICPTCTRMFKRPTSFHRHIHACQLSYHTNHMNSNSHSSDDGASNEEESDENMIDIHTDRGYQLQSPLLSKPVRGRPRNNVSHHSHTVIPMSVSNGLSKPSTHRSRTAPVSTGGNEMESESDYELNMDNSNNDSRGTVNGKWSLSALTCNVSHIFHICR